MILDTTRSGLHQDIFELFDVLSSENLEVSRLTPDLLAQLEAETSVHPIEITHKIDNYLPEITDNGKLFIDAQSRAPLATPKDYNDPAALVVDEHAGGGSAGAFALARLRLTREVANTISARLKPLGAEYLAVHIRHTDYATDYEALLDKIAEDVRGKRLLVCSDSHMVKAFAKKRLEGIAECLEVSDIPDLEGAPLHETHGHDRHQANLDLLCDLLAMARAQTLFYANVADGFPSGFSKLTHALQLMPSIVNSLLSNADPELALPDLPSKWGRGQRYQVVKMRMVIARRRLQNWVRKVKHSAL